jgi:hypothetical protein
MAKRIQRKRTKGWRMPEGVVYVGRPSKWGNPLPMSRYVDAQTCIDDYKTLVYVEKPESFRDSIRKELIGKDLACWCSLSSPCHGDILLEIANGPHQTLRLSLAG